MKQLERIQAMEALLDESREVLDSFEDALEAYNNIQDKVLALEEYYGEDWMKDLEDDEAGNLPQDLKRGVLSEDALYDLLTDNRRLLVRMLEVSAEVAERI